jgi:PAS domain S-box-containing protein
MTETLKVLLIEDALDDAFMIERELRKGGFLPSINRVMSAEEFRKALQSESYDIVISDYHLPAFDGGGALEILKASELDLPFIVVSGMIGESLGIEMMRKGAHDYIMKDKMSRLPEAIRREIMDAKERQVHRAAQKALIESEAKYRKLHEYMRDAFFMMDRDGCILDCNDAFCQMLGRNKTQIQSNNVRLLTPVKWHELDQLKIAELMSCGKTELFEKEMICADGSIIQVEQSIYPVPYEFERHSLIGSIVRDITARKREEQQLRQTKLLAEHASRSKDDFLANMSHELRTPLNGVLGFTSLLLEMEQDPRKREMLSLVKRSGDYLLTLVNNVLDIAKIESGKMQLDIVPFALGSLMEDMDAMFRVTAEGKQLGFKISEIRPVCLLMGDSLRIKQILVNVIGNAIKFTEKGAVTIEVSHSTQTDSDDVEVSWTIRDTGIGIASKQIDRLYEKFEQGEHFMTKRYAGSGLGLAIVKSLIDLMHGKITIEPNESGVGTKVHYTLTFKKARELAPA